MGPGSAGRGATRGTLKQPTPEARPGAGKSRSGAPRGARAQRARGTMQTAAPFGAPLPVFRHGEWDDRRPRAAKNRGDRARLIVIPGRAKARTRNPETPTRRVAPDSGSAPPVRPGMTRRN